MMQVTDVDMGELFDEANMLLLAATLDVPRAALLIAKLRACATQVEQANNGSRWQKLREVADKLERRLLET